MTDKQRHTDGLTVLALETCTESCSAALIVGDKQYFEQPDAPREHSQRILPMVDAVLTQANIQLSDIDVIAYGRGPGSFTGIRICTSMTQGLALGRDLPVIGISTLQTMAQGVFDELGAEQVIAAIDARMGEVYWGQFTIQAGLATLVDVERVCGPQDVSLALDPSKPIVACGTGFDAYPELLALSEQITLTDKVKFPFAKSMLALARQGVEQGLSTSVDELAPVYLRDTVTWKKLPGRE